MRGGVREVFRAALGADDATWARGRGWALSIALLVVRYYRTTNPVMAAIGQHVVQEVLTDHGCTPSPPAGEDGAV